MKKSWAFFEKNMFFFFKIGKGGKFAYQMILFLENVFFTLIVRFFCKNQTFKFGKITKFDEERQFFTKKHFHPYKGIINKIGGRKRYRW